MERTSARRSSRARISQPPHSTSNGSSTSSTSSGRADRSTRAGHKANSPRKSTPSGSLSSEGLEESIATTIEDSGQSRRKKRGQVNDTEKTVHQQTIEMPNTTEDVAEDDEAVRCVCGYDDYPGPPPPSEEDSKYGIKDGNSDAPITDAELTDDLAGFFLQCDVCKVWQHGACVGIKNETTAPEEYFCEQCRKDLHKLSTASNGQRYSQYLPLYQTQSRTSSRAGSFSKDGTRSPRGGSKSGRPSSAVQNAKRRSTMNSRDAAYDEEEQLRQAIEASKGEDISESVDGGTRNGKRGRSDSEEKPGSTKRQRTNSNSSSPPRNQPRFPSHNDDEDGHNPRSGGQKKIRGAAARNHKEKLDREERERMRKEAANNRQSRLERRKVDEPPEEHSQPLGRSNKASKPSTEPQDVAATSKVVATESPPSVQTPPVSHKKGGRPPNARKGKLGRNQYTKDKDQHEADNPSPGRSQSRDISRHEESTHSNQRSTNTTNDSRQSKSKSIINSKITWPEMRRRVDTYLNFIAQTQIEMAQDPTFLKRSGGDGNGSALQEVFKGLASELSVEKVSDGDGGAGSKERDFSELNVIEQMDHLTREMIKWQKDFVS